MTEERDMHHSHNSFLDTLSFYVLFFITFLLPIFFVPMSFISTQFGTSLFFAFGVILAGICYIIARLSSGSIYLPTSSRYILGITASVPVVYLVSGFVNGFSRMTFFGYTFDISTVGFILIAFVYLFLASVLFNDKNKIFYSYLAFLLSSLVFSVFLLTRLFLGTQVFAFGIFNTITDTMIGGWNSVGIFFGVCVILSLITRDMLRLTRLIDTLLVIAGFVSLFFIALVNFSLIWIVMTVSSFLFVIYKMFSGHHNSSTSDNSKKLKNIPLYPALIFLISLVFVLWGNVLGPKLASSFKIQNIEARPSFALTLDIAKNTLKSHPLFGSGPNTFLTQWLSYKPDDINTTIFWNTDFSYGIGLLPTFAVTTGLIGLLSWLVFLGLYIFLGVRSIFTKIEDMFVRYLVISSFFVSLYLWIMMCMYVPSTVVSILTFFFTGVFFASLYIAKIFPLKHYTFMDSARVGFVSSLVLVAVLVASLGLSYGLFKNSESLWYFQKSSYALNVSGDVVSSENLMKQAIADVSSDAYYRALSEIELFKLNKILTQDTKTVTTAEIQKQFAQTLSDAISAGLSAKTADPDNYLNWIALGRVYQAASSPQLGVQGAYQSAQIAYNEALRRNPKNPVIYVLLAQLEILQNNLTQAEKYVKQSIAMKPNYLDAYFLLTQIQVANKDLKSAISSVGAASVISPNDPNVFFQLGILKYNIQDYQGAASALERSITLAPEYANAKYFLGLSYYSLGRVNDAVHQFADLKVTNPDNAEVASILSNLQAGRAPFTSTTDNKPEKRKTLPVKER